MKKSLTSEQRNFLQRVAETAFVNPFSDRFDALEERLLPDSSSNATEQQRLTVLLQILEQQFQPLLQQGRLNIEAYRQADRRILLISLLYYLYRRYQQRFDRFIQDQQHTAGDIVQLPFAEALIDDFIGMGFDLQQVSQYIALFFQLRRGFYFISHGVHGHSPSMVRLRMHLWNNIFTCRPQWYLDYFCGQMEDFSTLLLGATGTGKSMIAQAIGSSGYIPFDLDKRCFRESFTAAFQAINLSQYPASLLESELFGHRKGAFTGAIDSHQGLFARCSSHGAVFIDEIGDIDLPTQVKLLTVIQERIFSPVGSHEQQRFQGRVIAATNRDLDRLRSTGQFRNDLYYRLCSDVIAVPSLQQRLQEQPEELPLLIGQILSRIAPAGDPELRDQIAREIHGSLPRNYAWPGNVRELEQRIRHVCLTGTVNFDIPESRPPDHARESWWAGEPPAQQLLQNYCRHLYAREGSYEAVARITGLDRRTVKKHLLLEH